MAFTVREGRSGDMGSGHKPASKGKKSNWHNDLDEKGQGKEGGWKEESGKKGTKKGTERKTKKGAY